MMKNFWLWYVFLFNFLFFVYVDMYKGLLCDLIWSSLMDFGNKLINFFLNRKKKEVECVEFYIICE